MAEAIRTQCPDCGAQPVQADKRRNDEQVTAALTCGACGNEWTRELRSR